MKDVSVERNRKRLKSVKSARLNGIDVEFLKYGRKCCRRLREIGRWLGGKELSWE